MRIDFSLHEGVQLEHVTLTDTVALKVFVIIGIIDDLFLLFISQLKSVGLPHVTITIVLPTLRLADSLALDFRARRGGRFNCSTALCCLLLLPLV